MITPSAMKCLNSHLSLIYNHRLCSSLHQNSSFQVNHFHDINLSDNSQSTYRKFAIRSSTMMTNILTIILVVCKSNATKSFACNHFILPVHEELHFLSQPSVPAIHIKPKKRTMHNQIPLLAYLSILL